MYISVLTGLYNMVLDLDFGMCFSFLSALISHSVKINVHLAQTSVIEQQFVKFITGRKLKNKNLFESWLKKNKLIFSTSIFGSFNTNEVYIVKYYIKPISYEVHRCYQ